jgi:hypothetical protein
MRSRLSLGSLFAAAGAAAVAAACGSPTTPPVVINTPPIIDSLVVAGTRAEANQPIQVTATVKDVETPINQLTYSWSALPQLGIFGSTPSFGGSEVTNTWRPPTAQTTPDLYTLTLTVGESYTSAGQAKQNITKKSTAVHYNDSPAEVTFLARDFLVDKFGVYAVTAAQAVSNFSDSTQKQPDGSICADEKAAEFDQITNNRANFTIQRTIYSVSSIAFNADNTFATILGPCTFEDIPKPSSGSPNVGQKELVPGTCLLTTVYENFQWRLCKSNFFTSGGPTLESLKGRVPGRAFIGEPR